MAGTVESVFLASSIKEFKKLRAAIRERLSQHRRSQLVTVDLGGNDADHRPPLARCLAEVRRAEYFVLLLGRDAGSTPDGQRLTYTQLEYREARSSRANCHILVFDVGAASDETPSPQSEEDVGSLSAWRKQLLLRHTVKTVPVLVVDEQADAIVAEILDSVRERRFADADDEWQEVAMEAAGLDSTSFEDFQQRDLERLRAVGLVLEGLAALVTQMKVAADRPGDQICREQLLDAVEALIAQDALAAVHHLRRAYDVKPRNFLVNYWLAKVYLSSRRRARIRLAVAHARRAAVLARKLMKDADISAMAALVLSARAARELGDTASALQYARDATDSAAYVVSPHIALLRECIRALADPTQAEAEKEALDTVRTIYNLQPPRLEWIISDPEFAPLRPKLRVLREAIGKGLHAQLVARQTAASQALTASIAPSCDDLKRLLLETQDVSRDAHYLQVLSATRRLATSLLTHTRACVSEAIELQSQSQESLTSLGDSIDNTLARARQLDPAFDAEVERSPSGANKLAAALDASAARADRLAHDTLTKAKAQRSKRAKYLLAAIGVGFVSIAGAWWRGEFDGVSVALGLFGAAAWLVARRTGSRLGHKVATLDAQGSKHLEQAQSLRELAPPLLESAEVRENAVIANNDAQRHVTLQLVAFRDGVLHGADLKTLPWDPISSLPKLSPSGPVDKSVLIRFRLNDLDNLRAKSNLSLTYHRQFHSAHLAGAVPSDGDPQLALAFKRPSGEVVLSYPEVFGLQHADSST